MTIHYRQGDEEYEKRMPQDVIICSPVRDPCPLPEPTS